MAKTAKTNEQNVGSHWWWLARLLLCGVPIVAVAIWCGRSLGRDWAEFERWISELGFWGPLVLALAIAILTPFLVPDTPLSMAAGGLFGLAWGGVAAVAGAVIGAMLAFWLSHLLLQKPVRRYLDKHPRWSAIERAAAHEGLRLQLLIRLSPMPSASFSYVMGASRLDFRPFAIGCIGMIPGVMVEVYLGHMAGHVASLASGTSHHSIWHTVAAFCGLVVAVIVMTYVARLARRAIAQSEAETETRSYSHPAN